MRKVAVAYHYPCVDGVFAALAAHLYFSITKSQVAFFPNTVYDPIGVEILASEDFDEIYLLDFVGPQGFVSELSSKVKSIIILDHHKTSVEMFSHVIFPRQNVHVVIDMNRSGATIAYDFFKEKLSQEKTECNNLPYGNMIDESEIERIKYLFKLVEDGDLWRWALPNSKAFSSGLKDLNIEFNANLNPCLFHQLLALEPNELINKGLVVLRLNQKLINAALDKSYQIALGNGQFDNCLATNADDISHLRSELGEQLARKSKALKLRGIGAIVYKLAELNNDNMLKISLRSVDFEDTTVISQSFGGGGHRSASSFMLKSEDLEIWKKSVYSCQRSK